MQKKSFLLVAGPLLLVLFIDGMGLGLIFPILNSLIIDPASNFLSLKTSIHMREFLYGLVVGIFMLCWFFGAAFLGDLSDAIGRKKSLIICLLGAFLGYLLSAIAVIMQSFTVLVIGRMIAGFTAGSQPIAQAAIVDISAPEHKARNIGFILLAVSLGFIFGPLLGGLLSDSKLIHWFSYSMPMYFASGISLLNLILLLIFFQETFVPKIKFHFRIHHAIEIFISAFQHEKIERLSLVFAVFIFGWANYITFIGIFLYYRYHFSTMQVSLFWTVLAAGFGVACGFLVDYLSNRYQHKKIIVYCIGINALGVLLTLIVPYSVVAWILAFVVGLSNAVAYSMLLTVFSNLVSPTEQGWVMGVTGSIMALCFGLTSLLTGIISEFGVMLPLSLATLGLLLSAVLLYFLPMNNNHASLPGSDV